MKIILIKLGGSLITDKTKPLTAKQKVIGRLMREIKESVKKLRKKKKIIIGHGSGSFGHYAAQKYGLKTLGGLTEVHNSAAKLNRLVTDLGRKVGLPVISFPPSSWILARHQQPKKIFVKPIRVALKYNLIPIVFGDLIIDLVQQGVIFSTEKVFSVLIEALFKSNYRVEKIIHCGITDGVYNRSGETIPVITNKNFNQIKKNLTQAQGFDITGGMIHKVEESLKLAQKYQIVSLIINGRRKGEIKKAFLGHPLKGTRIEFGG